MTGMVLAADAVPMICTYCTDAAWVDWWWIRNVPGVLMGAGITLIAYLFKKRGEDKALARNLAESVRNEIAHILELLNDTTRTAIRVRPFATIDHISTDIYDGLLNSAAISTFDIDLQNRLSKFYSLFKDKPVDAILVSERDLRKRAGVISDELDTYIRQKTPTLGFF